MPSPTQIPLGMWPVRPTCTVLYQLWREGAEHSVVLNSTQGWLSSGPHLSRAAAAGGGPSPHVGRTQAEGGSTQRYSFFLLW